jgi:hypothetical protein
MSSEDPAGMGFFSLCHMKGVQVCSNDWEMDIPEGVFEGNADAVQSWGHPPIAGTTLRFLWPDKNKWSINYDLGNAAQYMEIDVLVNGLLQSKKPFIKDNFATKHLPDLGVTIGLDRFTGCGGYTPFCFQGMTGVLSVDKAVPGFTARVLIHHLNKLKLVLPARGSLVEGEAYNQLVTEIRRFQYQCVMDRLPHDLSHTHWSDALAMGVELPEAEARLCPFGETYPVHVLSSDAAVCYRLEDAHGPAKSLAMAWSDSMRPALYAGNGSYKGYKWYDALKVVNRCVPIVDGVEYEWSDLPETEQLKSDLGIRCTFDDNKTVTLTADLLIESISCKLEEYDNVGKFILGKTAEASYIEDYNVAITASWLKSDELTADECSEWDTELDRDLQLILFDEEYADAETVRRYMGGLCSKLGPVFSKMGIEISKVPGSYDFDVKFTRPAKEATP